MDIEPVVLELFLRRAFLALQKAHSANHARSLSFLTNSYQRLCFKRNDNREALHPVAAIIRVSPNRHFRICEAFSEKDSRNIEKAKQLRT